MKRTTKRLISILICLAMALALLPMTAFAAGTTTVYCQAPESWTNCNIHYWGDASTSWPGVAMSQDANGIWYFEVPEGATGLLFHNNSGTQSSDQPMPSGEQVQYVFENQYWTVYGKVPIVKEYYVAGVPELCGASWDPAAPANKMTANEDGTYSITYTGVAAGSYELKVTTGSWATCWGEAGTSNNYVVTVDTNDSTVVVSFDPATELVNVVVNPVIPEPDPVPGDDTLIGEGSATFADWDEAYAGKTFTFVPAEDGVVTVAVSTCDPGFFVDIYKNDEWVDIFEEDAPTTVTYDVTKGDSYAFILGTMNVLGPGLTDYAAGSLTYKITANVAAGEPSGGEGDGGDNPEKLPGTSEDNPQPIGSYYGSYIMAGQTIWYVFDNYEHMMQDGVYSQMLYISAGVPYAVTYLGSNVPVDTEGFVSYEMMDFMYRGAYVFSVTNHGSASAFFTIEVKDRPAYTVSPFTLTLGDNILVLDTEFDNTLYEFTPAEVGVYEFTVADGVVGNWGTVFNPQDNTAEKTQSLQWTCTAEGQSILVGVGQTEETVLKVEKVGEYVAEEEVPITDYENDYDFSYELPEDAELVSIDVLDSQADVAVLDKDGFYRYGSQYGCLMVADLNDFPINLADAYINGQLRAYVYDESGKVIARYDYNEAINEYLEAGLVPVTEELARMLKQLGDHHNWWMANGFVFEDEAPEDTSTAWMVACSYIKGSELTPETDDGGNTGGSTNPGGSTNSGGNNDNPKTTDLSMAWAMITMMLAGTCLVVLKKKESFFLN